MILQELNQVISPTKNEYGKETSGPLSAFRLTLAPSQTYQCHLPRNGTGHPAAVIRDMTFWKARAVKLENDFVPFDKESSCRDRRNDTSFLMLHWELSWILRRSQRLTILYRPQGKDHLSLLFESFDSDVSSCWNACRIDYQTGKALGKPQPGKVGFVWLGLLPGGRTKKGWCLQVSVQRSYPLFRIKYWFSPDLLSQG